MLSFFTLSGAPETKEKLKKQEKEEIILGEKEERGEGKSYGASPGSRTLAPLRGLPTALLVPPAPLQ